MPEGLIFIVSKEALSWALTAHDRVFKSLERAGAKVLRVAGKDKEPSMIACELRGERLTFTFREGYRKEVLAGDELAKLRAKNEWAKEWVFVPSKTFTWSAAGSERSLSKHWQGRADQIDARIDEIVASCMRLLEQQPHTRQERLAAEARRQEEAAAAEVRRRHVAARREQLEQAFKASEAHERTERLRRFLDIVEQECGTYNEPYGERAKTWLSVVREELKASSPYLEILGACLSTPSWKPWPPDWWPKSEPDPSLSPPSTSP